MLYIVEEVRHRTGRELVRFGDEYSRKAGRDFIRRVWKAKGRFYEYHRAGLEFYDLWTFDNKFRGEDPRAHGFSKWKGRAVKLRALAALCRKTALGIRGVSDLTVPLIPVLRKDAADSQNRIFASPWPPSIGRKLPSIVEDLDFFAVVLEAASPALMRAPHAPAKERQRRFRLDWNEFARKRSKSKGPLDRLGAILFNAVFGERVSTATFARRRKEDQRGRKAR